MTTATLSFTTPGRVRFRCDELQIFQSRELEANPPFERWSRAYETGSWSAEALLGIGLTIGRWFDGSQQWLAPLIRATAPIILAIETSAQPEAIEKAALEAPWDLLASAAPDAAVLTPGSASAGAPAQSDPLAQLMAQFRPGDLQRARHLALEPSVQLTVVRRLGPAALDPPPPSPYRLSVVFMAAQPDGLHNLQIDREEVAIVRAARGIGMDLAVEDSGSLDCSATIRSRHRRQ